MTDLEILIKARALIADPKDWTQGPDGEDVPGAPYCAMGAMRAAGAGMEHGWRLLSRAGKGISVRCWNDTHTHAQVLALFDLAIEKELEAWIGKPAAEPTRETIYAR